MNMTVSPAELHWIRLLINKHYPPNERPTITYDTRNRSLHDTDHHIHLTSEVWHKIWTAFTTEKTESDPDLIPDYINRILALLNEHALAIAVEDARDTSKP